MSFEFSTIYSGIIPIPDSLQYMSDDEIIAEYCNGVAPADCGGLDDEFENIINGESDV